MPSFTKYLTVKTKIGDVQAKSSITAADISEDQISFRAIRFKPNLPPTMSVKKCTQVLLIVEGSAKLGEVNVELAFDTSAVGYPCTGQCLDAQEWSKDGNLVVIGTEDGEALSYRYPGLGLEDLAVTSYADRSITVNLSQLGEQNYPSFYFIIAENDDPEPVEASAWFAVDQKHDYLLNQLQY